MTDIIKLAVEGVLFGAGAGLMLLFAVRNGIFSVQKDTVSTYKDMVEVGAEARADLEARVAALEIEVKELSRLLSAATSRADELQGMVEGKDAAITEMMVAVAKSTLCSSAFDCPNRKVPLPKTTGRRRRAVTNAIEEGPSE